MKGIHKAFTVAFTAVSASAFASNRQAARFGASTVGFALTTTPQPSTASCGTFWSTNNSRSASSTSTALNMSPSEFAKQEIEANKVVIFSKSFCPFCKKTKAVFSELGVDAKVYELNQMDDGPAIQDALLEMTGQKTVPNVFINKEHVGGNDNVQAAKQSGKLQEMLNN